MKLSFTKQQSSPNTQQNNNVDMDKLSGKIATLNPTNQIKLKFTSGKEYNLDQLISYKRRNNASCPLIVYVRNNNENDQKVIEHITKIILSDNGIRYDNNASPDDAKYYKNVVYKLDNFDSIFDDYFNRYYSYYYNKVQQAEISGGTLMLDDVLENISKIHDGLYDSLINNDKALTYAGDENEYNKPQVEFEYGTVDTNDGNDALLPLGQAGYYVIVSKDNWTSDGEYTLNIIGVDENKNKQLIFIIPHERCKYLFDSCNIKIDRTLINTLIIKAETIPHKNLYLYVIVVNLVNDVNDDEIPDADIDYTNSLLTDNNDNYLVTSSNDLLCIDFTQVGASADSEEELTNNDVSFTAYDSNNNIVDESVLFRISNYEEAALDDVVTYENSSHHDTSVSTEIHL